MATLATISALVFLISGAVGLLSVIYPWRFIGITSRWRGFLVALFSLAAAMISSVYVASTQADVNGAGPNGPVEPAEKADVAPPVPEKAATPAALRER